MSTRTRDARLPGRVVVSVVAGHPAVGVVRPARAPLATVWMTLLALPPYLLSRACIDDGLEPDDRALFGWTAAVLGIGVFNAWLGITRHRTMTKVQTGRQLPHGQGRGGAARAAGCRAGPPGSRREVVTIGVGDVQTISQSLTVVGPGIAAIVTYAGGRAADVGPSSRRW